MTVKFEVRNCKKTVLEQQFHNSNILPSPVADPAMGGQGGRPPPH